MSAPHHISSGVPQGSVLSPLLFNIMLHDFPLINSPGQTLLYADDIAVILPSYSPSEAKTLLQNYLDSVADWCAEWKFSISAGKCALLPFSRKRHPSTAPALHIDGQVIPVVNNFKFLGLIFDSKLRWNLHIQYVIKKCLKLKPLFYVITRSRSDPALPALLTLYKSLVRSSIDYGLIVYGSASKSLLAELDKV